MGRSDIADNTPDSVELEKVITIFEGGPLEATIAGRVWRFHQPTPVEFAKIKLRGTVLYQGTLAEPELAALTGYPESAEHLKAHWRRIGALEHEHETSESVERRAELSDELDALEAQVTTLGSELAEEHARRLRDYYAAELLLDADPVDKALFVASPAMLEAARPTVLQALILAQTVPNLQRHTTSAAI